MTARAVTCLLAQAHFCVFATVCVYVCVFACACMGAARVCCSCSCLCALAAALCHCRRSVTRARLSCVGPGLLVCPAQQDSASAPQGVVVQRHGRGLRVHCTVRAQPDLHQRQDGGALHACASTPARRAAGHAAAYAAMPNFVCVHVCVYVCVLAVTTERGCTAIRRNQSKFQLDFKHLKPSLYQY